jgi:hypothetical protein
MLVSTRYQKSIKPVPDNHVMMLKSGGNNKKLGRRIKKTAWAGAPIFSLTLTERDTCPRSCHHWDDCYGNNMPFAARYSVADYSAFVSRLEHEIDSLIAKHGKIAIRLHVLGEPSGMRCFVNTMASSSGVILLALVVISTSALCN